jgi:L-alanine-DL-glutamate epimerase-like enolase superfamily enzyme
MRMTGERLQHQIWTMELPLSRTVGTPGGDFSRVNAVVLRLRDDDGLDGAAYVGLTDPATCESVAAFIAGLVDRCEGDLERLVAIERDCGDAMDTQVGRVSLCAVSTAAWDLLGRQRGVPCAALWSAVPRTELDAYASFFFSDLSLDALVDEARHYRGQGFRRAKMRAGLPDRQDEDRYAAMCTVFDEPRSVAVEAFFSFTGDRVERFMAECSAEPMWIEDPMSYAVIDGAGHKPLIAAGETCTSLAQLIALRRAGILRLILDVQYLGGPLHFLEAARVLQALGSEVGSHVNSHESLHMLAALPESMPVEVFDWWQPIFNEIPQPGADGRLAVSGPGMGRTLNEDSLRRYGTLKSR